MLAGEGEIPKGRAQKTVQWGIAGPIARHKIPGLNFMASSLIHRKFSGHLQPNSR
jgi:hypothetical protein